MSHTPWENKKGAREVIDCWTYDGYSYAIILHPNNVLHLQWIKLTNEEK